MVGKFDESKMSKSTTIGVCGYGNTGASAVCDILKEFEDVQVFSDFEFDLFLMD